MGKRRGGRSSPIPSRQDWSASRLTHPLRSVADAGRSLEGGARITATIGLEQAGMAKKKDRAFFVCPRWNEVADAPRIGASGMTTPIRVNDKTLAAIKGGAARRSINAPQGVAGRAPDVGADVRRRCLHRGPAHHSLAVN
jgi:hypothetical protein